MTDGFFVATGYCMADKTAVYILRSVSNPSRYYIGITSDIDRRLEWHNNGQNVSTANARPWRVNVAFHFASEATAKRFEKYLKSGSGREFARRHFDAPPNEQRAR
jgi:predicted GIY-YIG superfamily endonuclease